MRAWVSTVVSPMKGVWPGGHEGVGQYRVSPMKGVWPGGHEGVGQYHGESYERGVARGT